MANNFYRRTHDFAPFTKVRGGDVKAEFAAIEVAFDKLPDIADILSGNPFYLEATGSGDAMVAANLVPWTTYTDKGGYRLSIKVPSTNTAPVTINLDGLGARPVRRNDNEPLMAGDVVAGGIYDMIYDDAESAFKIQAVWQGLIHQAETAAADAGNARDVATTQVALAADQVALASDQVLLAAEQVTNAQAVYDNVAAFASFAGMWADLVGSAAPPLSAYHKGQYWQLLLGLADVASVEPGTDVAVWIPMVETAVDIGQITYSFRDLAETGLFVKTGMSYLQGEYPELFGVIGIGEAPPNQKLPNPSTLPAGNGNGVAFSPDGAYLAVAHQGGGYGVIYSRSGDTLIFKQYLDGAGGIGFYGAAFSPDSVYLAVACNASPFVIIYKRGAGGLYSRLSNPSELPTGAARAVAFSPDGAYLAVGQDPSPFVTLYKRAGDTFTKLPNPSELPPGNGYSVAFSPDNNYMAVATFTGRTVTIYKRNGDTFSKLPGPAGLPGAARGVAFSPDGAYLAVAHSVSPFVTIYKRNGDTFSKLPNPSTLPAGDGNGVAFSGDMKYLVVAHSEAPRITLYRRNGDSFTKLPNPSQLPPGNGYSVAFSPDNNYMAVGHGGSPYASIYKSDYPFSPDTEFYVPDVDALSSEQIGDWLPLVRGNAFVRAK